MFNKEDLSALIFTGKNIGTIQVYSNVGSQRSRILKLDSETYDQWKSANAYIGRIKNSFF